MSEVPRQWHVYIVGERPCLAIQPGVFAENGLPSTVVLPLTTQLIAGDAFPLRVRIPKDSCTLPQTLEALVSQISARDNRHFKEDLGVISEGLQDSIKSAIRGLLDLES